VLPLFLLRQDDDDDDDDDKESRTGECRSQPQTTGVGGLGEQIAEGGTERTSEYVGGPEGKDRVELERDMRHRHGGDNGRKNHTRKQVTQVEAFGEESPTSRTLRGGGW
jgi:hypothetical protein